MTRKQNKNYLNVEQQEAKGEGLDPQINIEEETAYLKSVRCNE